MCPFFHRWNNQPAHARGGDGVKIEQLVPLRVGNFQCGRFAAAADVVNEDIDAAIFFESGFYKGFGVRAFSHVCCVSENLCA